MNQIIKLKKNIIELREKIYSDTLQIKVNKKNVKFNFKMDDCGNTFVMSKEELKKLLEMN